MVAFFFTDGSDLNEVRRPQDIRYMQSLRFILKILYAWPGKMLDESESKYASYGKYYILCIEFICLPPGILYLKNNTSSISFLELGRTYITVFMNIVATLRLILIFLKQYENLVADFVNSIHLFHHKNRSEYAMKTHILVHKISHFYTMYTNFVTILGIFVFTSIPLYKNVVSGAFVSYKYGNVTFEHSVYYQLPFDYQHDIKGYAAILTFNCYITYICSSCFSTFDLLMSVMVFHIWGHLNILIESLKNFRRPTSKFIVEDICEWWFSDEELTNVSRELKEIIKNHNLVIEFTCRMAQIFGPILALYYIFHIVSGCVLLLECSQMDPEALIRYGTLTVLMFQQLIQISVVFELLTTTSDRLISAIYSVPWECMDIANRKSVQIMLNQSQRLLTIKALDMVDVGVQAMASILKSSVSYFIMLRTFAEME